ncbi:hypothetical protein ACOMHN_002350 [Nucella lapillus]
MSMLLKDAKSKQLNSPEKDSGQKGGLCHPSSAKGLGELTHRSDSNVSGKDSNSGTATLNKRQACSRRWQSASSRVLKSNKTDSSAPKHSRKDVSRLPKREMTSPRIITINRVSTPSPENETKSKPPDKGDSRGKSDPSSNLYPPGVHVSPGTQQGATQTSSSASKSSSGPDLNDTRKTVTSSIPIKPTSPGTVPSSMSMKPTIQADVRCTRIACAVAMSVITEPTSGNKPSSEANSTVLQNHLHDTTDKRPTKTITTTPEEVSSPAPNQQVSSFGSLPESFRQFLAQSELCAEGEDPAGEEAGHVCPRSSDSGPQPPAHRPLHSVFLDLSKPQFIRIPFSVAADTDSDSELLPWLCVRSELETEPVYNKAESSSSTHTTPLSQRVYGSGDGAGSSPHPGSSQEAVVGSGEVGGWDSRNNELQKLRELHGNGARPLSRNTNHRKDLKAPYESFHEELRPLGGGLVGTKLPPNALKNHPMLRAEPCLAQRSTHGPQSGPEEDVVAMGSLWNSNHQLQTRGSSTVISTTTTTILTSSASSSSTKSISTSFGNGSGSGSTFTSISGSLPSRRPTLGATFTCHSSSLTAPSMGNIVKSNKERELEPKYCDPVPGAPPSFQQRLMELAALEAETVRWERSKKVKKKPLKQDKDS